MVQKANSLSQAKWMRMYHIVFTLQYRRKIIYIGVVWEMFFINYAIERPFRLLREWTDSVYLSWMTCTQQEVR